jgi:hypothetical protein
VPDVDNSILFKADGTEEDSTERVKIGGFTVTKDSLIAGNYANESNIMLRSIPSTAQIEDIQDTCIYFRMQDGTDEINTEVLEIETISNSTNAVLFSRNQDEESYYRSTYTTDYLVYESIITGHKEDSSQTDENGTITYIKNPEMSILKLDIKQNIDSETILYLSCQNSLYATESSGPTLDYVAALPPIKTELLNEDKVKAICNRFHSLCTGTEFTATTDTEDIITDEELVESYRTTARYSDGDIASLTKASYTDLEKGTSILIYFLNQNRTQNNTVTHNDYLDATYSTDSPARGKVLIPTAVIIPKNAIEVGSSFRLNSTGKLYAKDVIINDSLKVIGGGTLGGFNLSNNQI